MGVRAADGARGVRSGPAREWCLRAMAAHRAVAWVAAGGLGMLDELVASFTATGLRVTCDVTGQVRQLPEAADLTAYRLIQESLTNTAKHAAGTSASIRLAFRPETLALAVEDHGPPAGGSGAGLAAGSGIGVEGHGIIGMRERAAALGGWLTAGPRAGGGFRVLAELPAPAPPAPRRRGAMTAVRVLLADDQELVRAGLRMMVDSAPDLAVVAEAATGRQAVRLAREARADVVLMDIRMPEPDGLAATRQAVEDLAGVKVLILTTFEVDEYVFEALRSGASGFLGKGSRPDVLIDAIRTIARGDALLSSAATRGLIARVLTLHDPGPATAPGLLDALTDREREIVALVATGMSNAEIAEHLTLSPLTIKTHANHAMTKLGARERAQLVVLAYQAGLVGHPTLPRPPELPLATW